MAYYRGPVSPREDQFNSNPLSPPQRNPNRWSASMLGNADVRGAMQRRFTTNTVPTLSPIGQQRRQAAGDVPQSQQNANNRITPSERAARHYESLLQAQRKIQEELEKVDAETRREVDENLRHEHAVTQLFAQSEPTTPPEYNNFSNFSRPNRYSTASLTSPPGIVTRPNRSSTQLTSPSAGYARTYNNGNNPNLPSQSVPGSRRQSDDEEDEDDLIYGYDNSIRRAAANPNRNSMPITSYDRKRNTTELVLGPVNTTGFLFNDDEQLSNLQSKSNKTSPPDTKTYLQVQHTADGFPKLIRREENGDLSVTAASAALDLASSAEHEPQQVADRTTASRHRISLPPSALGGNVSIAPLNSILANANDKSSASNRRSMEVHFSAETKRPSLLTSPSRGLANGGSSSYSTNDILTLKKINNEAPEGGVSLTSPSHPPTGSNAASPEQNGGTVPRFNRLSHEFSSPNKHDDIHGAFSPPASSLQANAQPFGPGAQENGQGHGFGSPNMTPFGQPAAYYGGYGMQMLNNGFNNMNLGNSNGYGQQSQWAPNQFGSPYAPAQQQGGGYGGYQQFQQGGAQAAPGAGRFDNTRMNTQQRRQAAEDAQNRFNSIKVEQLQGEIYTLCKDQHGCRFLQRKLEERNETTVQIIFDEVKHHMIDLMVDPFGNYLCQKLLESANDDQRTTLIQNATPAMTKIALNQHGTRALQKMIEYISTPEQTNLIIDALGNDVVLLIQDLNGNHVIQKCLNHLSSADATFIFDAVGANCITVGTHRHGCCVLQRCIDHADGLQKGKMVDHVIRNAFALVQDPFGNYVVQYILDLSEPCFTEPLCRAFYGEIPNLSRQKFSSNVIEKCIRCATNETRRELISEIMAPPVLEKLLRDGFANYVVQTAMDFADEELKPLLNENVRMILPAIRNTPHGRRIQSKITDYDNRHSNSNGITSILSPLESAQSPGSNAFAGAQPTPAPPRANRHGMIGAPPQWGANGNGFSSGGFDGGNFSGGFGVDNNIVSPTPQRGGNQGFGMFSGNGAPQSFQQQNGFGGGFSGPGRQPFGHF